MCGSSKWQGARGSGQGEGEGPHVYNRNGERTERLTSSLSSHLTTRFKEGQYHSRQLRVFLVLAPGSGRLRCAASLTSCVSKYLASERLERKRV